MKKDRIISLALIALLLGCFSCASDASKNKSDKNQVQIDVSITEQELLDQLTYYRLPSPEELFAQIDFSELEYNQGLLLDAKNYKNFLKSKEQALALGVYITDLAYVTLFNQNEASMDYFEAVYGLSEQLRIKSAVQEPLLKRIASNIDHTDSLMVLSQQAYTDIMDFLENNQKEDVVSLITMAAFIETLHLTLFYVNEFDTSDPIVQMLIDQRFTVQNLYAYARLQKENKNVASALKHIENIYALYQELNEVPSEPEATTDEKTNQLMLSGGSDYTITKEQFETLKAEVARSRKAIISF
ncbi:MAG: hypothetical protein AB7E36_05810 [Salinivirgaceae bacterium]